MPDWCALPKCLTGCWMRTEAQEPSSARYRQAGRFRRPQLKIRMWQGKRRSARCKPAVLGNGRFKGQGTVQNGGLAERVSVEGAMLQYAVDVRLDEALSMLWHQGAMLQHGVYMSLDNVLSILWHQVRVQGGLVGTSLAFQVSQPPQPLNPFPKLMHIVR
eukprot:1156647-Pelagomonas_calceolata.AAC.8